MDMDAKIVVVPTGLSRLQVPFSLIIDERRRGEVSASKTEFAVEPGHHTARIEYVFVKSNTISFDAKNGGEVKIAWQVTFKLLLLPVLFLACAGALMMIPYNPTVMLYAGGAFAIFMPIISIAALVAPGMLYVLKVVQE